MRKLILLTIAVMTACSSPSVKKDLAQPSLFIGEAVQKSAIDSIKSAHPGVNLQLLEKGVKHAASLWRKGDGTQEEFVAFSCKNYLSDPAERKSVFNKISFYNIII